MVASDAWKMIFFNRLRPILLVRLVPLCLPESSVQMVYPANFRICFALLYLAISPTSARKVAVMMGPIPGIAMSLLAACIMSVACDVYPDDERLLCDPFNFLPLCAMLSNHFVASLYV